MLEEVGGLNFLFSVIHTTFYRGRGGHSCGFSIIFAPGCSYMYSVKVTGERFRSFEADHKNAYQEFFEK
jgi:hypothetical protein